MRRAVLQGLGDGDGSASVQGNYVCISSKCNKRFIHDLFDSFGIKTRTAPRDVVTTGTDEAKKAALVPPFRYSTERLVASRRIVARIENRRRVREEPLRNKEIGFILNMKHRGLTSWEVSEAFFDEFGSAVDHRTIERV